MQLQSLIYILASFSLDVDRPSILSELGQPEIYFIGKINHFDDNRVKGYAMATTRNVARLK